MAENQKNKLSSEPYKGVRDFYPEEMFMHNFITNTMREASESFGYVEYNASVLEASEIYEAKSGEEIVNEQTYTFKDRGDRSVTLRPEMTPTVARMVAQKRKELSFPLRWYSIPNLFRYERPQRGRLREHWQLNCDLLGVTSSAADAEIIALAAHVLRQFGANDSMFEIRVNHRNLLDTLFHDVLELSDTATYQLSKLIDRKDKISAETFAAEAQGIVGEKSTSLIHLLSARDLDSFLSISEELRQSLGARELREILAHLKASGVTNVSFSPTLVRGFDYYTGAVFEIFDTSPENNRSITGGGRYDGLVDLFGVESVPAVGFGMGDVTVHDFLAEHDLLPSYASPVDIYLASVTPETLLQTEDLARFLRSKGLAVSVDLTNKKVGDQIKTADKQHIPFVVVVGEEEIVSGNFKVKHLGTGEEKSVTKDQIADTVFSFIG